MTQQQKPNFIIIGAMKAATTSLYTYLKQHPDVFMTSIKEPMFFNNFQKETNFKLHGRKTKKITTFEQYYTLFNSVKNESAIGEASPSYISNKDCPNLIHKHLPNTKIIAVLRQPVAQTESLYLILKQPLIKKRNEKLKTGVRFTIIKAKVIMLSSSSNTLIYFQKKI